MGQCTAVEIARLMSIVPEWRRKEAEKFKHEIGQFCCLKSWEMLMELVGEKATESIRKNEFGKPYFEEAELFFSISHCKKGILVMVSESECGADIEELERKISDPLIEKTMNEEEIRTIGGDKDEFIRFWTQKEALLKKRGTGITDDLPIVLEQKEEEILTYLDQENGFAWSICQDKFSEEEKKMLSQTFAG